MSKTSAIIALLTSVSVLSAQQLVFVSRDEGWIRDNLLSLDVELKPSKVDRNLVIRKDGTDYVLDRRLIEGQGLASFRLGLRSLLEATKSGPAKLSELQGDAANWVRRQLRASPFKSPHMDNGLKLPDLKIGAIVSTKISIEVNGRTMEVPLMLEPKDFGKNIVTDEWVAKRERLAGKPPSPEEAELLLEKALRFVSFPELQPYVAKSRESEAMRLLAEEREKFAAACDLEGAAALKDLLKQLQGDMESSWDGKSPVAVKDLDPEFRELMEQSFASKASMMGFSSPEKAIEFFRGSRIGGAKSDIMLRWASRNADGTPFHQGFTIGGINP